MSDRSIDKEFRVKAPNSSTVAPGAHIHPESDVTSLAADLAARVVGPASATADNLAAFNGTTGKVAKDSGLAVSAVATIAGVAAAYQPLNTNLTAISGLSPSNDDVLQRKAGAWTNRSIAQLKTDLAYGTASALASDTDGTLAANSDLRVATQKAVKTYADGLLDANNAYQYKGGIDCSANPNYPAASAGHTYKVTVAGKIGGASGPNVEVGDSLTCLVDGSASGNHATVGANWLITQTNIDGAVVGPASSVSGDFVTFSGTTGKVVQDSGVSLDTDSTMAANSDARVPSQKAVKTALGLKAADSAVVHLAGAETITGGKTFDVAPVNTYQGSTPATPSAGHAAGPYFASDGLPYYVTPTGVVIPFNIGDGNTALHSNASFETVSVSTPTIWDTSWNAGGSFTTETTDVAFGSRSATVSTTAGTNFQILMSDVFTVAGGDTLSVAAWAHKITGSPKMKMSILTATSGTPNFFDGVSTFQESDSFALATPFTKYAKSFPVPAGHTVARFCMRFDPTASEATSSRVDFTTSSRTGASVAILPGNSWVKETCRAVAPTVTTLAGGAPSTADGVSLAVGDRVLVLAQVTASQNGIYVVTVVGTGSNGTWVRASDAATSAQLAGATVSVSSGTVLGGSRFTTSFKATDTLGTTAMIWSLGVEAIGTIALTGGTPQGWLTCDGTAYSRTTYAALFAQIGTAFGVGNGTTTFNVPDLRDRFPIGVSGTKAVGSTGGTLTHTHALSDSAWAQAFINVGFAAARFISGITAYNESSRLSGTNQTAVNGTTVGIPLRGATDSATHLPQYQAVVYAIKP